MSQWSDSTPAALGAEIQRAQKAAVDAFMAAHGGGDRVLTATEVADLLRVTWEAISVALLKHIGPVSSDSSVTFGVVNTGDTIPVPQLDIRATGGGDHLVIADVDDPVPSTLIAALVNGSHITFSVETDFLGNKRVRADVAWPSVPAPDDHLVLATSLDYSPGTLARKNVPGTNMSITGEPDPLGGQRLRHDVSPADTIPDRNGGAGYSGVGLAGGEMLASARHSHPEDPPAVVGSTFYPAFIPHPLRKPTARAVLTNGASTFGWATGAFVAVPNAPYTWQAVGVGPLMAQHASGVDPFAFADGDYFFAGFGAEYPPDPSESQYYGLYRVIDCGIHGVGIDTRLTRATFVRADEMNQVAELPLGAFVQITGEGAAYQGEYYVLTVHPTTLDSTPLAFARVNTVDAPPAYKLLTGPQLTTEGASNDTQTVSVTATNQTFQFEPETATLLGTPGLSEIPAGPFTVTARLRVSAAAGAGYYNQFFYRFFLLHADDSLSASFLDVTSPPIDSTVDRDYTFTGFLAAPVTCSPTDRVVALPCFTNTNPTARTIYFTYQDPTRATRIVVPFVSVAGNTTVPAGAITPGRLHTPFGDAIIDGNGDLNLPDRNDVLVSISTAPILRSINTAGWVGGDKVWLTFLQPLRLIGWSSSLPAGGAPLFLLTQDGIPDSEISFSGLTDTTNNRVCLQLRTDAGITPHPCWQIVAGPYTGVVAT